MRNRTLIFLIVTFLLTPSFALKAQITISSDYFYTSSKVKLKILDSLSRKPVDYASVFLVPRGDSTITHFTLTDSLGVAEIDEVTRGGYLLNIETLGYRPRQKEFFVRDREVDLGVFLLRQDVEALKAAKVTGVVNPITIKQDTLEYNAAAFATSENDMLEDLLKKMPGMEVSGDGSVKVNGESISKITVGGKSFFFDDKKTALTNLPAKIVDKIKVINKDSETSKFSGIADKEKEKVMDVELKEDFKKGWFGNASLKLGASLPSKDGGRTLTGGDDVLYDGNALAAAYSEKTQVTAVANARNFQSSEGGVIVVFGDEDGMITPFGGIISNWQGGVNVNSEAVKGMSLEGMVNYNRSDQDIASRKSRTSIVDGAGSVIDESSSKGNNIRDSFRTEVELKNTARDKWIFRLNANLSYVKSSSVSHGESETSDVSGTLSNTVSDSWSDGNDLSASASFSVGAKDLGKKGRSLTLDGNLSFRGGDSKSGDLSNYVHSGEILDLVYDGKNSGQDFGGTLSYVEPVAGNWKVLMRANTSYRLRLSEKTAFDGAGHADVNDYYSSLSDNKFFSNSGRLLAQWQKGRDNIQFGALVSATENETRSKTLGVDNVTGDGEWLWDFAPFVNASFSKGPLNLRLNYSGSSSRPGSSRILPALNISNPSSLAIGNVYLKPSFRQYLNVYLNGSQPKSGVSYSISAYSTYETRGIVTASWFDADGIRYSIPVNSTKPVASVSGYAYVSFPLTRNKRLTANVNLSPSFTSAVSYQAAGLGESLDKESFDYSEFMERFWGDDSSGSVFFSGESGFRESVTKVFSPSFGLSLSYRGDRLAFGASYYRDDRIARYSLDSKANANTVDQTLHSSLSYKTDNGFGFSTVGAYRFYRGYANGYGEPVFQWDVEITKNIKAITLSVKVKDILDNVNELRHTVSENWFEDSYTLTMGRHVMFGLKWNFGKMNQSNMRKAQSSLFNMAF